MDYEEAIFLWRVDKKDFLLWTITTTTTLFLGIEIGVLVGVSTFKTICLTYVDFLCANQHYIFQYFSFTCYYYESIIINTVLQKYFTP